MRRAMQTVGWGLYLASSWTWCIGMFLPILLLRWWGWPGFLAFAIPNVLGCTLFGYVLTPDASLAFTRRFGAWIRIFAAATIAYQVGFLLLAGPAAALAVAAPLTLALLLADRSTVLRTGGAFMATGAAAWLASVALFTQLGAGVLPNLPSAGTLAPGSLVWAAPFMAFGFLLCPYLDPTFHLALQRTPSRHAFAVFGAAFTAMLLFTAAYSDVSPGSASVPNAVLWHWGLQATFTMIAVTAAMRGLEPIAWLGGSRGLAVGLVVAACMALGWNYGCERWLPALAAELRPPSGAVPGEATYLRWLGLYGVLFPGMVLLGLRGVPGLVMALALVSAGVLAEFGMIGGRFPLLAVAVAVLVSAWLWPRRPIRETGEMAPSESR
jgi:hypothetical protein